MMFSAKRRRSKVNFLSAVCRLPPQLNFHPLLSYQFIDVFLRFDVAFI